MPTEATPSALFDVSPTFIAPADVMSTMIARVFGGGEVL